jgi:2-dehydropantoate 2-reductase
MKGAMTRRYIVLGAGAIGAALGGMLQVVGCPVILVARGAHLEAMRTRGLDLALPSRSLHLDVHAVGKPSEIRFQPNDVVLLCVKSQDTEAAVAELSRETEHQLPVVCVQNSVENEPVVARYFAQVLSMVVYAPGQFLEPGHVSLHSEPVLGGLDIGDYPSGVSDTARDLASDATRAGFDARTHERIAPVRYAKLLSNLSNIAQALLGRDAPVQPLLARLRAEAEACFHAARIEYESLESLQERNKAVLELPVNGALRGGGSTWQSLARGSNGLETEYLNGMIVRLGQRHHVPTPANHALLELSRRAQAEHWQPGKLSLGEVEAAIAAERSRHAST